MKRETAKWLREGDTLLLKGFEGDGETRTFIRLDGKRISYRATAEPCLRSTRRGILALTPETREKVRQRKAEAKQAAEYAEENEAKLAAEQPGEASPFIFTPHIFSAKPPAKCCGARLRSYHGVDETDPDYRTIVHAMYCSRCGKVWIIGLDKGAQAAPSLPGYDAALEAHGPARLTPPRPEQPAEAPAPEPLQVGDEVETLDGIPGAAEIPIGARGRIGGMSEGYSQPAYEVRFPERYSEVVCLHEQVRRVSPAQPCYICGETSGHRDICSRGMSEPPYVYTPDEIVEVLVNGEWRRGMYLADTTCPDDGGKRIACLYDNAGFRTVDMYKEPGRVRPAQVGVGWCVKHRETGELCYAWKDDEGTLYAMPFLLTRSAGRYDPAHWYPVAAPGKGGTC